MTRIGELFAGYGGLGMAVQQVYGGEVVWYSEFDPAPSAIMAHHHPGVPNYGGVTAIDWATVPPVDILTGGFPCQDVSVAGRRAGMTDGTRSGLWSHMAHAVDVLRPSLVVIENVGGLFSAEATRLVESHPLCLGDGGTGVDTVLLRAVDAVLSTLSELGYDAEWTALRAADVGAPHGRLRVFITAHPQGDPGRLAHGDGGDVADADLGLLRQHGGGASAEETWSHEDHGSPRSGGGAGTLALLPTPRTTDMNGAGHHGTGGMDLRTAATLLPTPTTAPTTGNGHARNLGAEVTAERFGPYGPAIHRWEHVLGRPAPSPTEPGKTRPRLSSRFVEWLMGLPDGHVTAVPGLTRNQELKALGNGVVPQQGAAALRHLHTIRTAYQEMTP